MFTSLADAKSRYIPQGQFCPVCDKHALDCTCYYGTDKEQVLRRLATQLTYVEYKAKHAPEAAKPQLRSDWWRFKARLEAIKAS